ncbi:MAG: hypothetical protein J6K42_02440 [Clostridia bacterium]|nr:hypothetical protein [Clostridia bacterium]
MEELDLKKLISIFWNKRLHIILISLITVAIGTIYSFYFVKPEYEAYTTVVLVKDATKTESSSQETITSSDLGLAKNLIGTYSKLVKSKSTLRETINNLGINESENTLANKITVSEIEDTAMLKITVQHEDPVQAMKIANEVTNVFAKKVAEIYKIDNVYTVDQAEESITPCNINHIRDILIFFVIGLVISIIYVLVANMFDTTIKDADDIENNTDLITLVSIPYVNENNRKGGIY